MAYRALKLLSVHGTPAFSEGELVPAEHVETYGYEVGTDVEEVGTDVEEVGDVEQAAAPPATPATSSDPSGGGLVVDDE